MINPAEQEERERHALSWPQALFALAGVTFVIPDPWVLGFVALLLGLVLCASFAGGRSPPRCRHAFDLLLGGLFVLAVVGQLSPPAPARQAGSCCWRRWPPGICGKA